MSTQLEEVPAKQGNPTFSLREMTASAQVKAVEGAVKIMSKVLAAQQMPRNMQDIEEHLLGYYDSKGDFIPGKCDDPMFAEQSVYDKGGIEGLGHHFAKYVASIWGNIDWESIEHTKSQAEKQTQIQVVVWDIEKNTTHSETVIVLHKQAGTDKDANTSDGIRQEVNRQKSILERNCLFDCFDKSLIQKCHERVFETLDKSAIALMREPDDTVKKFAKLLDVSIFQVCGYLGINKPKEQLKPMHIRRLDRLVKNIKSGEVKKEKIFAASLDESKSNELELLPETKSEKKPRAQKEKTAPAGTTTTISSQNQDPTNSQASTTDLQTSETLPASSQSSPDTEAEKTSTSEESSSAKPVTLKPPAGLSESDF